MASDGNETFPIPLAKFVATLVGTDDHVWHRLLQIEHGGENHTEQEWRDIIDRYRHRPAHRTG